MTITVCQLLCVYHFTTLYGFCNYVSVNIRTYVHTYITFARQQVFSSFVCNRIGIIFSQLFYVAFQTAVLHMINGRATLKNYKHTYRYKHFTCTSYI